MADHFVAAPRDATAYDRPNVRQPKVIHVAQPAEPSSVTGCLTLLASCSGALLDDNSMYHSLAEVPEHIRCRRRACAKRWPPSEVT